MSYGLAIGLHRFAAPAIGNAFSPYKEKVAWLCSLKLPLETVDSIDLVSARILVLTAIKCPRHDVRGVTFETHPASERAPAIVLASGNAKR